MTVGHWAVVVMTTDAAIAEHWLALNVLIGRDRAGRRGFLSIRSAVRSSRFDGVVGYDRLLVSVQCQVAVVPCWNLVFSPK